MMKFTMMLLIAGLWLGGAERCSESRFFEALGQIESGGDPAAIGDNGGAVGVYQIQEVYVDDVNRILGKRVFTYSDRRDPAQSKRMVTIYLQHYATERRLGRAVTVTDMARIHNGGPNGWKKKATLAYGEKFERIYDAPY